MPGGRCRVAFLAALSVVASGASALAQTPVASDPDSRSAYDRNALRVGLVVGVSTNFDDPYFQIGGGVGWFVLRGLELGVEGTALLAGDPFIFQLTPGLRYVFVDVPFLQPYIGFLYRRSFIVDDDDLSTMGGRVGVSWSSGDGILLNGGLAYERAFDCEETRFNGCNGFHPEFGISWSF